MPVTRLQARIARESNTPDGRNSIGSIGQHPGQSSATSSESGVIRSVDFDNFQYIRPGSISPTLSDIYQASGSSPTTTLSTRRRSPSSDAYDTHFEISRPLTHFVGDDLESLPSLSSWSSGAQEGTWIPDDLLVPDVPSDLIIENWEEKTSGTHGSIRKAKIRHGGLEDYVCIKLFTEDWKGAYLREAKAYALLARRGVRRCIPYVYWKGAMPLSWWNGATTTISDGNEIRYGLVMEWFDDYQEVDFATLDIRTAEVLGQAIERVHSAKVLHDDLKEGNILLVREAGNLRRLGGRVSRFSRNFEDPTVLTDEIFDLKFDKPRTCPDGVDSGNSPDVSEAIDETPSIYKPRPTNLRLAYSSFLFLQLLLLLVAIVVEPTSNFHSGILYRKGSCSLWSLTSLPTITVALSLFQSRNVTIDSGWGRRLAVIFVAHCVALTVSMIRNEVSSSSFIGRDLELRRILALCCIVWNCLCSIIASAALCRGRRREF